MKKQKRPCKGYREDDKYTCAYGFNQNHMGICAGKVDSDDKFNMAQCLNIELCGRIYQSMNGVPPITVD